MCAYILIARITIIYWFSFANFHVVDSALT